MISKNEKKKFFSFFIKSALQAFKNDVIYNHRGRKELKKERRRLRLQGKHTLMILKIYIAFLMKKLKNIFILKELWFATRIDLKNL